MFIKSEGQYWKYNLKNLKKLKLSELSQFSYFAPTLDFWELRPLFFHNYRFLKKLVNSSEKQKSRPAADFVLKFFWRIRTIKNFLAEREF